MFRYVILILASCSLAACATTTDLIERQNLVVKPSEAMYKCDTANLPDPRKLTDKQVAKLIEVLVQDNVECKNSLRTIHAFEEKADGTVTVNPKTVHKLRLKATGR